MKRFCNVTFIEEGQPGPNGCPKLLLAALLPVPGLFLSREGRTASALEGAQEGVPAPVGGVAAGGHPEVRRDEPGGGQRGAVDALPKLEGRLGVRVGDADAEGVPSVRLARRRTPGHEHEQPECVRHSLPGKSSSLGGAVAPLPIRRGDGAAVGHSGNGELPPVVGGHDVGLHATEKRGRNHTLR